MKAGRLPLWFRAATAALFAALLIVYFVVKQGAEGNALARSLVDRVARQYGPLLGLQGGGGSQGEPTRGAYTVNGMRVAYKIIPSPGPVDQVLPVLQQQVEQAGFKSKIETIQGTPTLIGVHPHTRVMVGFRPLRGADGRLYLRVSQQNLGDVKAGFVPSLPNIPSLPGARDPLLVSSLDGAPSKSLMYAAPASVALAADFYRRELASRGWEAIQPPVQPPAHLMGTLFFRRVGEECSVVLLPSEDAGEVVVFVSLTEEIRGGSGNV